VTSEALAVHRALESVWARLLATIEDARFEPRSDLIVAICPGFPIPQCNGPWVTVDSAAAVDALPDALAEVEAAGEWPWVQTRRGHERTQARARELGLTHVERIPAMIAGPDEVGEVDTDLEIEHVREEDVEESTRILADSFGAPQELFKRFAAAIRDLPEAAWYAGRLDGAIVSTAVGIIADGATGIFNVATPPEHRRRGYGAALTAHAARDGLDGGAKFAFLQSSELGYPVYRGLGFRDVEEYILFTRPSPS
jgi:N-acetylglutamate synthase